MSGRDRYLEQAGEIDRLEDLVQELEGKVARLQEAVEGLQDAVHGKGEEAVSTSPAVHGEPAPAPVIDWEYMYLERGPSFPPTGSEPGPAWIGCAVFTRGPGNQEYEPELARVIGVLTDNIAITIGGHAAYNLYRPNYKVVPVGREYNGRQAVALVWKEAE